MSTPSGVGLPEALERAASALPDAGDAIRPANGDPSALLEMLDPATAGRVLAWLFAHETADAIELAEAWAEDPERGVGLVLGLGEAGLPKEGRKALRRLHHQMRSRGVEVPKAAPAPTVAVLPRVEEEMDRAMLSPLDPRGGRVAFLVRSHPAGGVRLFEVVMDPARGILDCRVYNTGRSKVRKLLKEFAGASELAALEAPPAAVRALVARCSEAQSDRHPAPRSFSEWRGQLTAGAEGAATPGELARQALGGSGGNAALARAAELVRDGEIGPWPPENEQLQPLAARLSELGESAVIVSAAVRRERADEILGEALAEIHAGPAGERTAVRFDETAWVLWQRGKLDDARACLAAADAFRAGDAPGNPVARALLEAVLAPLLKQLEAPPVAGAQDEG